jgi:hypothetical protein
MGKLGWNVLFRAVTRLNEERGTALAVPLMRKRLFSVDVW